MNHRSPTKSEMTYRFSKQNFKNRVIKIGPGVVEKGKKVILAVIDFSAQPGW